jgi:hypothetical protein
MIRRGEHDPDATLWKAKFAARVLAPSRGQRLMRRFRGGMRDHMADLTIHIGSENRSSRSQHAPSACVWAIGGDVGSGSD